MSASLKALHDQLLAERPEGAEHDAGTCPLCALEITDAGAPAGGPEGGSMSTFTQEQVDAAVKAAVDKAVADATAPLTTRIAELEQSHVETETGKAVAEAVAPLNEQVSDLQRQLDEAKVAQAAAEEARTNLETWWANAITEQQEAEAAAARKDERLVKLKEAAPEPAHAYLEENADRFAAMSDEDFEARLEEYKTISGKTEGGAGNGSTIPAATALTAAREGAGGTVVHPGSLLSELGSLRHTLTDPRTL